MSLFCLKIFSDEETFVGERSFDDCYRDAG